MSRYESDDRDSEYQPGSSNLVLRNLLSIVDPDEMELAESNQLAQMQEESLEALDASFRFTTRFVCDLHRQWLGSIYPFAGTYRVVNVSKGFTFAVATYIPGLMADFETGQLRELTPCEGFSKGRLAAALAAVHAELLAIHPFREGNGRLARWVASLMAAQAGFAGVDFGIEGIDNGARTKYFAALRKGYVGELSDLESLFGEILSRSGP